MGSEHRGLNWGCGPNPAEGWWNSDITKYDFTHIGEGKLPTWMHAGDIRDGLPMADEFFDGIVANHSLQCLTYDELDPAVAELARVLRSGGRLRVLVPDVLAAFVAYQRRDYDWRGFAAITEPWDLDRKFPHYLTWGGSNRSTFTERSMNYLLLRHNLVAPARYWRTPIVEHAPEPEWAWLRCLDSRLGESLVVEAIKE